MNITILTGAGISAESGIETFRSSDGLWCNHKVEEVATLEGFVANPKLVYDFYNQRRKQLLNPKVKPNVAHLALAELEHKMSDDNHQFLLITQNIDNLHAQSGSQNIISMHGELLKVRCQDCGNIYPWLIDCTSHSICPGCKSKSLRPHIVWFGEMPFGLDECYQALMQCDVFAAIGTSGLVYPAAGFAEIACQNGAKCVEINLEKTESNLFDEHYIGKASEQVPFWIRDLYENSLNGGKKNP